jgi:hypothetical protein
MLFAKKRNRHIEQSVWDSGPTCAVRWATAVASNISHVYIFGRFSSEIRNLTTCVVDTDH